MKDSSIQISKEISQFASALLTLIPPHSQSFIKEGKALRRMDIGVNKIVDVSSSEIDIVNKDEIEGKSNIEVDSVLSQGWVWTHPEKTQEILRKSLVIAKST